MENKEAYFSLKVYDDSMVNARIFNGSEIIVHKQSDAEIGEIVVVALNETEAIVRRLDINTNGQLILSAENDGYKPIVLSDEAVILGVVKEVRTRYE